MEGERETAEQLGGSAGLGEAPECAAGDGLYGLGLAPGDERTEEGIEEGKEMLGAVLRG